MDSLSGPGVTQLEQSASLELLPPEILLPIVTSISGLDTLWNLLRASPNTLRLFSYYSIEITEAILSGPNSILPPKVRELVRGVILARSRALPFKNLDEFRDRFMCGIIPFTVARKPISINLGPATLPASNVPGAVLLSVVATAHRISCLSQDCLASCLERIRALKPLHPLDPEMRYTGYCGVYHPRIPAWDRKFVGVPAKVIDTGQPTWVEEMRVVRAMWIIQLMGEVKLLAANKTAMPGWSDEDVDMLNELTPAEVVSSSGSYADRPEEVASVMKYLETYKDAKSDVYYRLPRPPPGSATPRWTTTLPVPDTSTWLPHGYIDRDNMYHPLSPGSPVPAGAHPLNSPQHSDEFLWGKTENNLKRETFGMVFYGWIESGMQEAPPIAGVRFGFYRKLGFAFWDHQRMHLLGLVPSAKPPEGNRDFYYFAWESILPAEEVERIKARLREKRRLESIYGGYY